jgi:hypothetical protein
MHFRQRMTDSSGGRRLVYERQGVYVKQLNVSGMMVGITLALIQTMTWRDEIHANVCGVETVEQLFGVLFAWFRFVWASASKATTSKTVRCTNNDGIFLNNFLNNFFHSELLSLFCVLAALFPCI